MSVDNHNAHREFITPENVAMLFIDLVPALHYTGTQQSSLLEARHG